VRSLHMEVVRTLEVIITRVRPATAQLRHIRMAHPHLIRTTTSRHLVKPGLQRMVTEAMCLLAPRVSKHLLDVVAILGVMVGPRISMALRLSIVMGDIRRPHMELHHRFPARKVTALRQVATECLTQVTDLHLATDHHLAM